MSATATGIRQIGLVCIATPEQDRAIAFYESLGFEKRTDVPFGGGYRWIEVYPPEGNDRASRCRRPGPAPRWSRPKPGSRCIPTTSIRPTPS